MELDFYKMPSFKPKTIKKIKISKKNATTLDGKHKELLGEFAKDESKLKELKAEKNALKKQLSCSQEAINNSDNSDSSDNSVTVIDNVN